MISTRWDHSLGVVKGITPYLSGQPAYDQSLDACENMLVDFRGYLKQRAAVKHIAYFADTLANSAIAFMAPYSYQNPGNIRGMIAFVQGTTQWFAIWSDGTTTAISAAQPGTAIKLIGTQTAAAGNTIIINDGAMKSVTYNGSSFTIAAKTFTAGTPSRGLITFQGRTVAASGNKTIIGSKVGTPDDFTLPGTPTAADAWSVTLDMQGTITNLLPSPKGGIIVFCDDSQWFLAPGSTGLISAGSVSAQKLTNYEIDGEARQTGADIVFCANSTINKYNYSNEMQAYSAGKIAPTVTGKWLECFEAGGNYYTATFQKTGLEREVTILEMSEPPRATSIVLGPTVSAICPGNDGLFIATTYGIGFMSWYNYLQNSLAIPLDFWQVQPITIDNVTGTGTGIGTIVHKHISTTPGTNAADSADIHLFYDYNGLKEIPYSWDEATKTISYDRTKIIALPTTETVKLYSGLSYDMVIRTHRLEHVAQEADGSLQYSIGKKKNATNLMLVSNAVGYSATFTAPVQGDMSGTHEVQPDSQGHDVIQQSEISISGNHDYETKVQITIPSAQNADREVIVYGMAITWEPATV